MTSSSGEEEGLFLDTFIRFTRPVSTRSVLRNFNKLDTVVVHPLENDYAQEVNLHTSAADLRTPKKQALGLDGVDPCSLAPAQASGPARSRPRDSEDHTSTSNCTPVVARPPGQAGKRSRDSEDQTLTSNYKLSNTATVLAGRELNYGARPGLSAAQKCHLCCYRNLPKHPEQVVDRMDSHAYIGQYNATGNLFVAAFQGQRIKVYDVDCQWKLRKDIHAPLARWTITDTSLSPDQRFLIYSSLTPEVHLVDLGRQRDEVTSISNITDVHEALHLDSGQGHMRASCIWSVAWSGDGRQIVAGSSPNVLLYDLEAARVVACVQAHEDDVNAITYADDSPDVIVSGSDDSLIKVWDRRTLRGSGDQPSASGVLVGHTEGLTHLHARGDGRHILSNCKDQTAKLWDLRCMVSEATAEAQQAAVVAHFDWDYRRGTYPGSGYDIRHPHDQSLMTFRGHGVLRTLIRAYFSPAHTTAQRYIYTGSFDGSVHIYDSVTGRCVEVLKHHKALVRDVSWHPFLPQLTTVSWDGTVVQWGTEEGHSSKVPLAGRQVRYWQ